MKKVTAFLLTAMLFCSLLIPVSALEWIDSEMVDAFEEEPDWYGDATIIEFEDHWTDGATNANGNTQGERQYIFLKNKGLGDYTLKFTVDKDGIYNFGFELMGWKKSVLRATNVKIDDGEFVRMAYDYEDTTENVDHFWSGLSAALTAGEHTLTLSLTSDFDDSTVKSLYFDNFFYSYAGPIEVETEAETVAEAAVEIVAAAPQTFDMGVLAAIAAVTAAAGYAVSRKR